MAAARYNLDFIAKMGFDYVAYQHLDPEAPFYYNNAGNYRHAPVIVSLLLLSQLPPCDWLQYAADENIHMAKLTGVMACTRAGNEAGAYLQFMIDHYDCLPKVRAAHARASTAAAPEHH